MARHLFILFIVSVTITTIACKLLIPWLIRHGQLDMPNERSSHRYATPRGGGIAMVLGLSVGYCIVSLFDWGRLPLVYVACALTIGLLGHLEDRLRDISPLLRLLAQVMCASFFVWIQGGWSQLPFPEPLNLELGVFGAPIAVFWIVSVVNLFNFLDGIDGYAGLHTLIVSLGLILISDIEPIQIAATLLAGSSLGFLFFNWHPAKVFMGDVGSLMLGFSLAALPFLGEYATRDQTTWHLAMLMWFFLADGSFTILHRILKREPFWKPHRTHVYQLLTQTGLGHRHVSVVMALGTLIILCAVWTFKRTSVSPWWSLLVAMSSFGAYTAWARIRRSKDL